MQDVCHGMEYCMGYDTEADRGVSIEAIVKLLDHIKTDAAEADTKAEARQLYKIGTFVCMVTSGSLRGNTGYYADLAGLREHIGKGRDGVIPPKMTQNRLLTEFEAKRLPHVAICLLENFKGEGGINYHMINVAN